MGAMFVQNCHCREALISAWISHYVIYAMEIFWWLLIDWALLKRLHHTLDRGKLRFLRDLRRQHLLAALVCDLLIQRADSPPVRIIKRGEDAPAD